MCYNARYTDIHGWINYHSAAIRADDNLYIVKFDPSSKYRATWTTNLGLFGGIVVNIEELDSKVMTQDDYEACLAVANVKNTDELLLRLYGNNYQTDKELGKKTVNAHKKMLALWEALKS